MAESFRSGEGRAKRVAESFRCSEARLGCIVNERAADGGLKDGLAAHKNFIAALAFKWLLWDRRGITNYKELLLLTGVF